MQGDPRGRSSALQQQHRGRRFMLLKLAEIWKEVQCLSVLLFQTGLLIYLVRCYVACAMCSGADPAWGLGGLEPPPLPPRTPWSPPEAPQQFLDIDQEEKEEKRRKKKEKRGERKKKRKMSIPLVEILDPPLSGVEELREGELRLSA